jgi:hypothetical protein
MASSPTPGGSGVDFGRAFQFFFQDPDWVKKILIGGLFQLLAMILVGIPFVLGYEMRVLQRTWAGDPRPLPEWDDFGGLFRDGLKGLGLALVYFLGALLIPGSLGCLLAVAGSASGSETLGGIAAVGMLLLQLLAMVMILVVALYFPAAFIRMTLYQRFNAGFEFRENLDLIKRNPGNYAIALLIFLVANFVSQFGVILCCIGIFPVTFWSNCVLGFVLGEVARGDVYIGQPASAAVAPTV